MRTALSQLQTSEQKSDTVSIDEGFLSRALGLNRLLVFLQRDWRSRSVGRARQIGRCAWWVAKCGWRCGSSWGWRRRPPRCEGHGCSELSDRSRRLSRNPSRSEGVDAVAPLQIGRESRRPGRHSCIRRLQVLGVLLLSYHNQQLAASVHTVHMSESLHIAIMRSSWQMAPTPGNEQS